MAETFKTPKVGDEVNHVAPNTLKVTKTKVVSVSEKHDGRLVTVEVPVTTQNADGDPVETTQKVTVPHRPKDKMGGGTWHFAMILLLALLALGVRKALANIPTYRTFGTYGSAAAPSTIVLPADQFSQIRIVSINYKSDTNIANLNMSSGTTALSVTTSNSMYSGTVTNIVNATNGLSTSATVVLMHWASGVGYTNGVTSWYNTGTNIMPAGLLTNQVTTTGTYGTGPAGALATNVSYIVTTAAFPVYPSVSDEIYVMGTVSSLYVGAGTNQWINGDAIYSGAYGRPVIVSLTPANVSNTIPVLSTHYDSASQP